MVPGHPVPPRRGVGSEELAVEREDHGERMGGDLLGRVVGAVEHGDAAVAGRVQVDRVEADARAADDAHLRAEPFDQLPR